MILAGDIGGTKCNLALFELHQGKLHRVARRRFSSGNYSKLEDIVSEFIRQPGDTPSTAGPAQVAAAAFGVAGPVVGHYVRATNLPWMVDGALLARVLGAEGVLLLNDLEASAYGLALLEPHELCTLNEGASAPEANQALIAAGTGLGEAILFWDGRRHVVSATEGGHCDLAPRTEKEIELLRFLKRQSAQVDCEAILSGRGFRIIHEFLSLSTKHPSFDRRGADPAPEITRLALEGACPVCVETLDLWTALYGAEAGNLALKALARGGVYVGGGIAPKILPKLLDGSFLQAFCDKSKFGTFLKQIPIHVVLNEDTPLLGAAAQALAQVSSREGQAREARQH
jgi:glucokinase